MDDGAPTTSKTAYTIGWLLHAAILAAGTGLMIEWLTSTNEHFETQSFFVALGELVTALSALGLCLAYAVIFLRRGSTLVAALLFMFTYPILGLALDVNLRALAKNFPPATPEEAQVASLIAIATIVVVCSLSIAGVVAAYRFPDLVDRSPPPEAPDHR